MPLIRLVAALWLALVAMPLAAQTFPQLSGRVVDQANLLSPEQELDLTSKSEALEAQTGAQFVVATVNSLEGQEIEDYGYRLGRQWGLGREKDDDGVILLVAPNEKKVRVETGYGAEAVLPDILSGRIVRDTILPRFRSGDMAGGIMAGADAILAQLRLSPEQVQQQANQEQSQQSQGRRQGGGLLPVVFWMIVIFFVLSSMRRGSRGRRYQSRGRSGISPWVILWGLNEMSRSRRGGWGGWGGGGFGGGSGFGGGFGGFSGGGGSFGGGGASGSW